MAQNARQRAGERLRLLLGDARKTGIKPRLTARALAKEIGVSYGRLRVWIDDERAGKPTGIFGYLDQIAAALDKPPSFFVQADDATLVELLDHEARVVQQLRSMPDGARAHVVALLDFFVGMTDETMQMRSAWYVLRQLTEDDYQDTLRDARDRIRARRLSRGRESGPAVPPSSTATTRATRARRGQD